jgi:hypothetical protein
MTARIRRIDTRLPDFSVALSSGAPKRIGSNLR